MHQPHPGRRVGCWVCLGLWLIVLVGRLCCCLPDRVRPRSASGTRAPSEDASDLCTGLDPGGSVVDGLASGGVHHWRGLFRSFEGRTRRPPPGRPPSTPRGPAHRRRSAVAFQVPGGLGGGVPGCRGLGWKIVLSLLVGHLWAAISIASRTRGRCRAWSSQWRTRPLSGCSSPGTVVRQIGSLPGCGYRWMPPTHFIAGLLAAGARARTRSGREPRARRPGRWRRVLSAGPRPGGPWERTGGCAPPRGPRARAPAAAGPRGRAGTRRVSSEAPGSVLMKRGQSASSGGSRRHPARRLVVARPPGTPAPPAHQHRPGSRAPGDQWPPTPGATSAPPLAKYAAASSRQPAPPLLALRTARRAAPRVPADPPWKPSSPPGGGMIPALPAHPAHHSSAPADH